MTPLMKILIFIAVNIAGYAVIIILPHLAFLTGAYPENLTPALQENFQNWFFGGGTWAWLTGALISIAIFFTPRKFPLLAAGAPVYLPAICCLTVLVYFNIGI